MSSYQKNCLQFLTLTASKLPVSKLIKSDLIKLSTQTALVRLKTVGATCWIVTVWFFICPLSQAQNGPGGVVSSALWLDASSLSLANGSKVSSWTDDSGNGQHASQVTTANQPTYITNGINGKPIIRFSRATANQFLQINTSYIGTVMSNSNTIFVVAKASTGGANSASEQYQSIITAVGTHSGIEVQGYPNVTNLLLTNWVGGSSTSGNVTDYKFTAPLSQNSWFLATMRNLESGNTTSGLGYMNGNQIGSSTLSYPMTNYTNNMVRIGAANTSGGYQWPLNGDIAAIIAYNSALNSTQRIIVENYLAAKYGLSISNDYYSSHEASYVLGVQGIGTVNGTEKHTQANSGGGLVLKEANSSLNAANEFLFSGYNSSSANASVTTDLPGSMLNRWQRNWFIQKTGSVDASLWFVCEMTGIGVPTDIGTYSGEYRLLYRSTPTGPYSVVTNEQGVPIKPTFTRDSFNPPGLSTRYITTFYFDLANGSTPGKGLVSGYYTIGRASPDYTWKSDATNTNWNDPLNWVQGDVPSSSNNAFVGSCTVCPQLSANVTVKNLTLNAGSSIDLKGYTLNVSNNIAIDQSSLKNTSGGESGKISALNFTQVQGSTFVDSMSLEKTGGTTNTWNGGNLFKKKINIVNLAPSSAPIQMATQTDDVVEQ